MISTKTNPVKNHDNKYYLDLNESVFVSDSRKNPYLRAMFKSIASKETSMKKREIEKISDSMEGKTLKQAIKVMDKHLGNHVVFYYGMGDKDPRENELKLEKPISVKKKTTRKKKSTTKKTTSAAATQNALEENLKKHTKKGKK